MIQIYHNNRCRKSREGLEFLKTFNEELEIIDYLNNPPDANKLKSILAKLHIKAIDLVRKNEYIWKTEFKSKNLNEREIIDIMVKHPRLIERPIVIRGNNAVLARPAAEIRNLFD